ncbi:hypothetical protein ACT3TX_14145, partial [Halomonas sp. AOP23-I1-17]
YLKALWLVLKKRCLFTTTCASSASFRKSAVLVDGSANGRLVWTDANSKTLKAIQDVRLSVI